MSLAIRHVSLAELLSRPAPFQMARYQRHYEWTRHEMDELLDDLGDAFAEHIADPARGAYHFLGNVILYTNAKGEIEVVDGQQRLTSLTLLLAIARDALAAQPVAKTLIVLLCIDGDPARPRLHLHRGDDEFLRDHIFPAGAASILDGLGGQDTPSTEHLRGNAVAARSWLGQRPTDEQDAFIQFVLDRGRFVEILVGDEDNAFRIFETVNSRGRPITSEDVLRYALVEYATNDAERREELLGRWDEMEAELGTKGMKRFIASWRGRVTKGIRPRQPLHRILLDSFSTPAEARAFLDGELSGDLTTFQEISTANIALPEGPDKKRIDTILHSLALVDFDEWLPVVTELIGRGRGAPGVLVADLARVERLVWYFYLNRDDKGIYQERRARFATLLKSISATGTLANLPRRTLIDAEGAAKMRDIVQERIDPKWIPLRSLLVRLEMALLGDGVVVAREDVTIEHVLPLRPKTKAWLSLYNNNIKTVTDNAQRIGNLCLVSEDLNTRLGNLTYANKRRLMLDAGVPQRSPLAADIAKDTEWTREVIARRTKWLVQVYCDTFDVHAHRR